MAKNSYDGLERRVLQWLEDKPTKERLGFGAQQPCPRGMKLRSCAELNSPRMSQVQRYWGCGLRPQRRNQINWASNGLGMQAIFLCPNSRSCGTGVFIPRTEGTDHEFSKKPEQHGNIANKNDEKLGRKKKKKEDVIYISPDIILPKEWTY